MSQASGNSNSDRAQDGSLREIVRRDQARRLMALTDLTSLNDSDDGPAVRALAALARAAPVPPACVCIWPQFISVALAALQGSDIPVCAVANFPAGAADPADAAAQTAAAVAAGANEVDVVFPYQALLAGDTQVGLILVRACREACADRALLKVILETGELPPKDMRRAADLAIEGGAHFLKTSTGKTSPAATPAAALILIEAIAAAAPRRIGFKASGGIRTLDDAAVYLTLYERKFGAGSASPANFRIGASGLFKELIAAAESIAPAESITPAKSTTPAGGT
jgi:deoxyribose-phosphate aldolase